MCCRFRGITTGPEFPSLYHSICQIPQRHHADLCPAALIVILQTCNLWETSHIDLYSAVSKDLG